MDYLASRFKAWSSLPKKKKKRSLKLNYPAEVPEKLELLQSSPLLKCAPALINSVMCPFMNSIFGCRHFFQLQKFKQIDLLGKEANHMMSK